MTDTRGDQRPKGDDTAGPPGHKSGTPGPPGHRVGTPGAPAHKAGTAGAPGHKAGTTGAPRDEGGTAGGPSQEGGIAGTPRPGGSTQPHHAPPPGAQPRRDRREQTRSALLTAAERLWAEHGIHGASLDDIAAAAGLTKGAVYSNFAGKTDLLLALMERFTAGRSIDVCDELHAAAEDGDPTGRSSPRHDTDDRPRRLALLLVEFWLYGMRDYAAGWRIADWYAERRAQMASELEPTDAIAPDDRATLALALDFGLALQHLMDPDRVPADLYKTGKDLMLGPTP